MEVDIICFSVYDCVLLYISCVLLRVSCVLLYMFCGLYTSCVLLYVSCVLLFICVDVYVSNDCKWSMKWTCGSKDYRIRQNASKNEENQQAVTKMYSVLKVIRTQQYAKFQAIPPMRSPENSLKSQIWLVSLSHNAAKMRKINSLWTK